MEAEIGHCELPGSTRGTRTTPCFICGVSQGRWTGQCDARVASKHSIINRQTCAREQQYRQRCSCAIPSRSAGPSTSACPTRCTAEWNTGQYYLHVRRVESREQARGQRRLATEHEQSAAHNEDDDRRGAATRGHQGSPSGSVVRLMIAAINVTSATSSGGAMKAHTPDTGGLNITGHMAELDYLFSEAELDIIGVQERRLPQTQILQTRDYTVFNSGASLGKHHYGVQLWIKKRHAKAVKSTEAVNTRLLVAKIAMRSSSHDRVARTLHVFVIHVPCEVAAPHDFDAFYMQVHECMNAVPRCLLLGDFNARVGSTAADCFGKHAPVTENQNGERMRELLTENMVTLNTFFPGDPYTWSKVFGRPARLDKIFVPAQNSSLPPGGLEYERTSMSEPRTTGLLLQMCTFRLESQEETKECKQRLLTATLFMTNKDC